MLGAKPVPRKERFLNPGYPIEERALPISVCINNLFQLVVGLSKLKLIVIFRSITGVTSVCNPLNNKVTNFFFSLY